jgi:hypothetical protein
MDLSVYEGEYWITGDPDLEQVVIVNGTVKLASPQLKLERVYKDIGDRFEIWEKPGRMAVVTRGDTQYEGALYLVVEKTGSTHLVYSQYRTLRVEPTTLHYAQVLGRLMREFHRR